jgi:hypothetical protein
MDSQKHRELVFDMASAEIAQNRFNLDSGLETLTHCENIISRGDPNASLSCKSGQRERLHLNADFASPAPVPCETSCFSFESQPPRHSSCSPLGCRHIAAEHFALSLDTHRLVSYVSRSSSARVSPTCPSD